MCLDLVLECQQSFLFQILVSFCRNLKRWQSCPFGMFNFKLFSKHNFLLLRKALGDVYPQRWDWVEQVVVGAWSLRVLVSAVWSWSHTSCSVTVSGSTWKMSSVVWLHPFWERRCLFASTSYDFCLIIQFSVLLLLSDILSFGSICFC